MGVCSFQDSGFVGKLCHSWRLQNSCAGNVASLFGRETDGQVNISLVVAVGYVIHASWKMDLPVEKSDDVDKALKSQMARIMEALRSEDGRIEFPDAARKRIVVDGYQIVDIATNRLITGGQQIPVYFPQGKPLPSEGTSLHRDKGWIHLVRTDSRGQLLAVTSYEIGDAVILAALFTALLWFLLSPHTALESSFLRKYFILGQMHAPSVDDSPSTWRGAEH